MDTVEELSQKSGDGITADDLDWPKSRFKPKLPKRRKVVKDPVLKAEQIKIRREEAAAFYARFKKKSDDRKRARDNEEEATNRIAWDQYKAFVEEANPAWPPSCETWEHYMCYEAAGKWAEMPDCKNKCADVHRVARLGIRKYRERHPSHNHEDNELDPRELYGSSKELEKWLNSAARIVRQK